MRELRERYPRPDTQLGTLERRTGSCSPRRTQADTALTRPDYHRSNPPGYQPCRSQGRRHRRPPQPRRRPRYNAHDDTQAPPFTGQHKPVNQTVRHFAEALPRNPVAITPTGYSCSGMSARMGTALDPWFLEADSSRRPAANAWVRALYRASTERSGPGPFDDGPPRRPCC